MAPRPSPAKNESAASSTTGMVERRTHRIVACSRAHACRRTCTGTDPALALAPEPARPAPAWHWHQRGTGTRRSYHRSMKTVAVIGASPDRRKFGNKALRAFREAGYRAIPITPRACARSKGERAYAIVLDFPGPDRHGHRLRAAGDRRAAWSRAGRERASRKSGSTPAPKSPALLARARALGIEPIAACSIIGIGMSPSRF